ncbi:MAG: MAPEG family protein [Gammaproteobacteria bacterium]|nr:MAPEG family protein [Gammaproteobacteria bacterium]
MTLLISSILFAIAMIIVTKVPVAIAMRKQFGHYDNKEPRYQEYALTGFGRRAMSAHENSIEALPIFAIGAVIASIHSPDSSLVLWSCITFVCARVLYVVFYLANLDKLRSIVWALGFIASVVLITTGLP